MKKLKTFLAKPALAVMLALAMIFGGLSGVNNTEAQYYQYYSQVPQATACYNFTSDLSLGGSGAAVEALHTVLAREGFSRSNTWASNQTFNEETASLVAGFQEKYRSDILTPAGYRYPTGVVGAYTRNKLNTLCNTTGGGNGQSPVVTNLSAPTSLRINETGTWTVTAYDPQNGSLTYSVRWGDEPYYNSGYAAVSPQSNVYNQQTTFTHSYTNAGTYRVSFKVRDNQGLETESAATVTVSNTGGGGGTDISGLNISVNPTKTVFSQDENITFAILARNTTAYEKTLTFPSGCQTSYKIGTYDSQSGQICTLAFTTVRIPAYGTYTWNISHSRSVQQIPLGTQTIVGRLAGYGESYATITVTVPGTGTGNTNQPQVIAPNGGEWWKRGEYRTIQWLMPQIMSYQAITVDVNFIPYNTSYPYSYNDPYYGSNYGSNCPVGTTCPYNPSNPGSQQLPSYPYGYGYQTSYSVLRNTMLTSYNWYVGSTPTSWTGIPAGNYRMQVCVSGTNSCDLSDNYFYLY